MKRLISCVLLLCCAAVLCVSCAGAGSIGGNSHTIYEKYYDIPGVTAEEIAAVDAIRAEYGSFRFAMNTSNEAFVNVNGEVDGFSSLLCEWLTELFDIPFSVEIVEKDILAAGLESLDISFTGTLSATEENLLKYHMTDAIAERTFKSFRLKGAEPLANVRSMRILKYAFIKDSDAFYHVNSNSDKLFVTTYVESYDTAVALLRNGTIDAFFEDSSAEAAFDFYKDVEASQFYPHLYTSVSLATADTKLRTVIDIVQRYIENGAMYHLTTLYNKGEDEYLRNKLFLQLTDEELRYLETHGSVRFAAEFDNYPASFYNETELEWQGIAFDVLADIGSLTGLRFEVANASDVVWSELFEMLEKGEVSFVTELIPSADRTWKFLWPEEAYSIDSFALISLTERENIRANQIWYSTIAVPADTAYEEAFVKWFPNHPSTLRFDKMDDCYLALENGSADFVLASRNSMLSMTNYSEKPGFRINILFDNEYESAFGFNKNEAVLCSIVSKAQKLVNTKSITETWEHRVFDYRAKMISAQIPYLIGLAVLLLAVLILVVLLLLRNRRTGRSLEQLVGQRTRELEIQTEAAKAASSAKSEFLSRMSHEIRTPLNAIIGMAHISHQVPEVPLKAFDANNEIITASQHLLGLLNDILDMAKIESGKFTLISEPFELLPAMNEVAEIIAQRSRETNTPFLSNLVGVENICVIGDKLRLKQVLINLLGNAVKFTDADGLVTFSVRKMSETDEEATLEFVVEDTGIGMSDEQMSKLFIAFEQTDNSISVKYGGTGLGLAISQSMVSEMGGKIEVESTLGVGSRFWYTLTFQKSEMAPDDAEDKSGLDLHGLRILLAEDVEINRIICGELLSDTGAQIVEAEDGKIAVEKFSVSGEGYYDLVFMDIQMPNMNGYDAAAAIRALDRGDAKTVPIIAMTANAYNEDVEHAMKSGMNAHIAKPLDIAVMRSTIRKTLQKNK